MDRGDEPSQAFYAGVGRPREIDHDSNLYATYQQEEPVSEMSMATSTSGASSTSRT